MPAAGAGDVAQAGGQRRAVSWLVVGTRPNVGVAQIKPGQGRQVAEGGEGVAAPGTICPRLIHCKALQADGQL